MNISVVKMRNKTTYRVMWHSFYVQDMDAHKCASTLDDENPDFEVFVERIYVEEGE